MNIYFNEKIPDKDQFYNLFLTTGWNEKYRLDADELFKAIKESWYKISAYYNDRLVGFGRIICDGVVHALILDMIVHPSYKWRGIGTKILNALVERCQKFNVRDIQLFCAENQKEFYKKNGFEPRPNNAPGMEYKRILKPVK